MGDLSAFDCDAAGSTAYLAAGRGELRCIDLRAGRAVTPLFAAHDKRINSIHVDPTGGFGLVTSSGALCRCEPQALRAETVSTKFGPRRALPLRMRILVCVHRTA